MSWQKKIQRAVVITAGIFFLLATSLYVIVHTGAFHRFVLEQVIEGAQKVSGASIDIKRVDIHWNKLRIDLYGLVVYGNGGVSQPPLFRGDHLGIGLKIISIFKRKVDIAEIVLDRPVLDVRVSAKGETNLPKPASPNSTPNTLATVFDAAIGHVLLNSGQVDYNDEQIPLSADLRDVRAELNFGTLSRVYQGSLGYSHGRIAAEKVNPIEHSARLNFTATRSEFDFDPVVLVAGNSRLTAHAKLTDYARPSIEGNYDGVVVIPEIAQIMNIPSLPAGQVAIAGSWRYRKIPGMPVIDGLDIDGRLNSPQMDLRAGQFATIAKAVRGRFSLEKGNLHVSDLEADLLEGHLNADGEVWSLDRKPSTRINAAMKGVSLESARSALPSGYDRLHFMGRANVELQAHWANGLPNVLAHSRATIAAPAKEQTSRRGIPLQGILDVRYDGPRDTASFAQSHLQTGSTAIALSGTVSKVSNLRVQADTKDLREVSALVSEISAVTASFSPSASRAASWDVRGSAHFSGQVSGAVRNPRLEGQLSASNVEVDGSRWRLIQTSLDLASTGIALQNGMLESAARGQLSFNAKAGLKSWSLTPNSPLTIQTTGTNLSLADLERLAKQSYPVDGTVSATVSIGGTKQDPSGRGTIQITRASAWGEPVNSLAMNFEAGGDSIRSAAELRLPAGMVTAGITFRPQTEEYEATVDTPGLNLDQIGAVQRREWEIAGRLKASARGQGTLKDPQLSANLTMSQLRFRDQSISTAEARLNLEREHANVTLHSVIAQGSVEAKGDVALTGDYESSATIDVRALPVGALLSSYLPASQPNLQGQTEIHADLHGPLKDLARVQAHMEVPAFSLAYQSVSIALARPLRVDYRQGTATLEETELKGTGTDVTVRGAMPVKSGASGFNMVANGTIDLSLLQGLARGVKSSGRIDLELAGRGDLKRPTMQGQVRIENGYFSSDSSPLGMEGVNGRLDISGNRLEVTRLTGNMGGGTVSMQGFMIYQSQPNFSVGLQATSVRLRYPEGLRSILNCDLHLNGTAHDSTLSGRVLVERLSFTQEFDLASFMTEFTSGSSSVSPSLLAQNMRLEVAIQSSQNLNLASSQLSMQGAANLNLTGTLATPVILGRATLTGGDIFALGKRYEVQNGTIEFSNPVRTQAVVNLYVHTTVQQYDITLNFVGPVDRLRTNYISNPPLAAADIINLLAWGKTAEESATSNVGAESVVAQGVASQVSGQIQKLAGISQLSIDPLGGNNATDPGAQVAIQQRITGNILLTFSTDVTSTQATSIQLQYRMSRQTSISVLRDQNGGYAVDIRLHKTF